MNTLQVKMSDKEIDEREVKIKELQNEKEELKKNSERLEGKLKILELETEIRRKSSEITDCKELIKANSEISQKLVEKGIIANDDMTYFNNNQKMEKKINEYQKQLEK